MLAMGDIAGPVLFHSLLISDGILLLAVGLLALCLRKRSLIAVVIASIFVLIAGFVGITFVPLVRDAFSHALTSENFDDVRLIFWCRVVSVIWLMAIVTAVACFIRVIRTWKSKEALDHSIPS